MLSRSRLTDTDCRVCATSSGVGCEIGYSADDLAWTVVVTAGCDVAALVVYVSVDDRASSGGMTTSVDDLMRFEGSALSGGV